MDIAQAAANLLPSSHALPQVSVTGITPIPIAPQLDISANGIVNSPSQSSVLILTLTPEQLSTFHTNPASISNILSSLQTPIVTVPSGDNQMVMTKKVPPKKNYRQRGAVELPYWKGKPMEELVEGFTWKDLMMLLERYSNDHNTSEIDLTDFARSGAFPVKIRKKGLFKCGLEFCCREWCKADILYWSKKSQFGSNFKWKLPPEPENYVSQTMSSEEGTISVPLSMSISEHMSEEENLNDSSMKTPKREGKEENGVDMNESVPSLSEVSNSSGSLNSAFKINSTRKTKSKKSKYEVLKRDCSKGSVWWKLMKEGQKFGQWHSLNSIRGEKSANDMLEGIRTFEDFCDKHPSAIVNFDVTNSTNPEDHVPDAESKVEDKKRKADPKDEDKDTPVKKVRSAEETEETKVVSTEKRPEDPAAFGTLLM